MAYTYGFMNMVTSFGFTKRWRNQCLNAIEISSNSVVLDLMSGMGELSPSIAERMGKGQIIALDISEEMCIRAKKQEICHGVEYEVMQADFLNCPLEDNSIDFIFSSFGLKTFDLEQMKTIAIHIERILKPGGEFSFLEISVPRNPLIKIPYLFYIAYVIPFLGRVFLGNPENYRLLGVYTKLFGNCDATIEVFENAGLQVEPKSYFFGCATGFTGKKPD